MHNQIYILNNCLAWFLLNKLTNQNVTISAHLILLSDTHRKLLLPLWDGAFRIWMIQSFKVRMYSWVAELMLVSIWAAHKSTNEGKLYLYKHIPRHLLWLSYLPLLLLTNFQHLLVPMTYIRRFSLTLRQVLWRNVECFFITEV